MSTSRAIRLTGAMVRATLAGSKTQIRLPITPQPQGNFYRGAGNAIIGAIPYRQLDPSPRILCPFGEIGDRLWVQERWQQIHPIGNGEWAIADPLASDNPKYELLYAAEAGVDPPPRWRGASHMPRWASRITLAVTAVRVERVQDISAYDCIAEGFVYTYPPTGQVNPQIGRFKRVWDSRYASKGYSWDENPWVWVGEVELIEKPR